MTPNVTSPLLIAPNSRNQFSTFGGDRSFQFPKPYNPKEKIPGKLGYFLLERDTGIEPVSKPWEGLILPLY
jgi:hypothetical protein